MYRNNNGVIEDSFQAFLVEGAEFTKIQEEYPIIRKDMVAETAPIRIMPFNKAINYQGDLSKTFVHFYCQDQSFERIRRNPRKYLNFFKRTAGFIGFDYSIHTDMQVVKQKSQINDNLSHTYYYANQGNLCIPNIRCGVDELKEEFFEAIPKNSLVAIGTFGFVKTNYQKADWFCFIQDIIENLNPSGIIVVGTLPEFIIKEFEKKCPFYFYESWMVENRKEFYNEGRK